MYLLYNGTRVNVRLAYYTEAMVQDETELDLSTYFVQ